MLHVHNMALLVDSNLLVKILQPGDMANIHGALTGWIRNAVENADQKPVGKTITLIVTEAWA